MGYSLTCPIQGAGYLLLYFYSRWKVLRIQHPVETHQPKKDKSLPAVKQVVDMDWGVADSDDWGTGDSDDWGNDNSDLQVAPVDSWAVPKSEPQVKAQETKQPNPQIKSVHISELVNCVEGLSLKQAGIPTQSDFVFDSFYISVTEDQTDTSAGDKLSKHSRQLLEQYENEAEKLERFEE